MPLDLDNIRHLIQQSGFPLELQIAEEFAAAGFDIKPSYMFFDVTRGKDTEVDLFAVRHEQLSSTKGNEAIAVLEIAVECKDHSLPYVLFGMKHSRHVDPGFIDYDCFYCHIETSRDNGMPNKYAVPMFDSNHGGWDVKAHHHHFLNEISYYFVTAVEEKGRGNQTSLKLHVPDSLSYATAKLGAFIGNFHRYGIENSAPQTRYMEKMVGIVMRICFLLLVHSKPHYRYTGQGENLVEATHTPIRFNRSYTDNSISYIVDFVSRDQLQTAITAINDSFSLMARHIARWVWAAKGA